MSKISLSKSAARNLFKEGKRRAFEVGGMMLRKAQVGIEYMMIFGFALVIVLPFIYYFYAYSQGPAQDTSARQAELIARRIVDNAETVYSIGDGTKTTFRAYMPDTIISGDIRGNEVIFLMSTSRGNSEIAYASSVNLTGIAPDAAGTYNIHVEAFKGFVNVSYT